MERPSSFLTTVSLATALLVLALAAAPPAQAAAGDEARCVTYRDGAAAAAPLAACTSLPEAGPVGLPTMAPAAVTCRIAPTGTTCTATAAGVAVGLPALGVALPHERVPDACHVLGGGSTGPCRAAGLTLAGCRAAGEGSADCGVASVGPAGTLIPVLTPLAERFDSFGACDPATDPACAAWRDVANAAGEACHALDPGNATGCGDVPQIKWWQVVGCLAFGVAIYYLSGQDAGAGGTAAGACLSALA